MQKSNKICRKQIELGLRFCWSDLGVTQWYLTELLQVGKAFYFSYTFVHFKRISNQRGYRKTNWTIWKLRTDWSWGQNKCESKFIGSRFQKHWKNYFYRKGFNLINVELCEHSTNVVEHSMTKTLKRVKSIMKFIK